MSPLERRTVLLTGASQGIGAATAKALGRKGANLVAHHQGRPGDLENLQSVTQELAEEKKMFVAGNFTDNAAVDRVWNYAVDWRSRVDVLVLNAAMMEPTSGFDDPEDQWNDSWDQHYQVNVVAPTRLMRAAVRHYRAVGGGVIVLMSSWVAQRGASSPRMLAYAASKSAIKAVAQSVARSYSRDGIYTYIIAPGIVRTRMSVDFANLHSSEQAVTDSLTMREWVPPEELAELIAFLAQGKARHLSGATLDVNGATYVR